MLPAKMVEQLERLVGEVQSMSTIDIYVVGDSRENHVRYRLLRNAYLYRRAQAAFRTVRVAHIYEVPQPQFEHLRPRLTCRQRVQQEARRHSSIRTRHMQQPLVHRKRSVCRFKILQHARAASKYRHSLSPARRRVCRAELRSYPKRNAIVRIHSSQPQHRLGDYKADVVLKRVLKPLRPARRLVCLRRRRVHPHLAVSH